MKTHKNSTGAVQKLVRLFINVALFASCLTSGIAASSFAVKYEHDIEWKHYDQYGYEYGTVEDHDMFYRDGMMSGTKRTMTTYDYAFSMIYNVSYNLTVDTYNADGSSSRYSESNQGYSTSSPAPYYTYPGAKHVYEQTYGGGHDSHHTRVKVFTYSEPDSDDDRLYQIHVEATDLDTYTAIPYWAISVAGATLDANGNVVHGIPQDSSMDVTPTVAGHANYSFTVGVSQHVPKIKSGSITGPDITDSDNLKTIVGRRMKFYATVEPPLSSPVAYHWSVGGMTLGGYLATSTLGGAIPLSLLSSQEVSFVWVDRGEDLSAQCAIDFGGSIATVKTSYDVVRPVPTVVQGQLNNVIQLGNKLSHGGVAGFYGIELFGTAATPPGYSGAASWTQIVDSTCRERVVLGTLQQFVGTSMLDGSIHYPASPATFQGNAGSTVNDSPFQTSLQQHVHADDQFSMYFMFKPDGGTHPNENIEVPLAVAKWYWRGTGQQDSSTGFWTLVPNSATSALESIVETTIHPEWAGNISDRNDETKWISIP